MPEITTQSAQAVCPSYLKKEMERDKLCGLLASHVTMAQSSIAQLTKLRKRMMKSYMCDVDQTEEQKEINEENVQMAVMAPRINARVDTVTQALEQIKPLYQVISMDQSGKRLVAQEDWLELALNNSQHTLRIAEAVKIQFQQLTSIIQVEFIDDEHGFEGASHTGAFAGPVMNVIKPDCFFAYPSINGPLIDCASHGHEYVMHIADVRMKMESGEFFKFSISPDLMSDMGLDGHVRSASEPSQNAFGGDCHVFVRDTIHRYMIDEDKGTSAMIRVLWTRQGKILRIEPWRLPMSWYVLFQDYAETEGAFSEYNPGRVLADAQEVANNLLSKIVTTAARIADQPVIAAGSAQNAKLRKLDGWSKKQLLEIPGINGFASTQTTDSIGSLVAALQLVLGMADTAGAVNATTAGGTSATPNETATAENVRYQGFQTAVAADVRRLSPALINVAKLYVYWLKEYKARMAEVYPNKLTQAMMDEQFTEPGQVVVTGSMAKSMPEVQIQTLTQLYGLLKDLMTLFPPVQQGPEGTVLPSPTAAIFEQLLSSTLIVARDMIRALDSTSTEHLLNAIPDPTAPPEQPADLQPQAPPLDPMSQILQLAQAEQAANGPQLAPPLPPTPALPV